MCAMPRQPWFVRRGSCCFHLRFCCKKMPCRHCGARWKPTGIWQGLIPFFCILPELVSRLRDRTNLSIRASRRRELPTWAQWSITLGRCTIFMKGCPWAIRLRGVSGGSSWRIRRRCCCARPMWRLLAASIHLWTALPMRTFVCALGPCCAKRLEAARRALLAVSPDRWPAWGIISIHGKPAACGTACSSGSASSRACCTRTMRPMCRSTGWTMAALTGSGRGHVRSRDRGLTEGRSRSRAKQGSGIRIFRLRHGFAGGGGHSPTPSWAFCTP